MWNQGDVPLVARCCKMLVYFPDEILLATVGDSRNSILYMVSRSPSSSAPRGLKLESCNFWGRPYSSPTVVLHDSQCLVSTLFLSAAKELLIRSSATKIHMMFGRKTLGVFCSTEVAFFFRISIMAGGETLNSKLISLRINRRGQRQCKHLASFSSQSFRLFLMPGFWMKDQTICGYAQLSTSAVVRQAFWRSVRSASA